VCSPTIAAGTPEGAGGIPCEGGQLVFGEWTGDRIQEIRLINQIRDRVGRWWASGWQGVTPTTQALLKHWTDPERERPLFTRRTYSWRNSSSIDPATARHSITRDRGWVS
jgi:hypothetical protein